MFIIKCDKCNSVNIKTLGTLFVCLDCMSIIGINKLYLEKNIKELPTFDLEKNNKEIKNE